MQTQKEFQEQSFRTLRMMVETAVDILLHEHGPAFLPTALWFRASTLELPSGETVEVTEVLYKQHPVLIQQVQAVQQRSYHFLEAPGRRH